jgi:hypothetical protein
MKIRTGFISNSSSSSFIVALDKIPETIEETMKIFGLGDGFGDVDMATVILADLRKPENLLFTKAMVYEAFGYGWHNGEPKYPCVSYDHTTEEERKAVYKKWDEEKTAFTNEKADQFMHDHQGKVFIKLHYSDNDGRRGAQLEHGDHFYQGFVYRISNH